MNKATYRTHTCGELGAEQIGHEILLSGWVHSRRNLGGVIFIDLRDRYGITQVMFDPNVNKAAWQVAHDARPEFVLRVRGVVAARPESMVNADMQTGAIEITAQEADVLCEAQTPPFEIDGHQNISEELRLEYRYLDMRHGVMKENILFRSRVIKEIRDWMHGHNFVEIETPILTASSPEGARDFLVPSRLQPGKFYALPQAPQQYKQLLMTAGFDRYFQIAACMRDEDARGDRSPGEFYQLDVETSFMSQDEFMDLMEPMFVHLTKTMTDKQLQHEQFPKITYKDAMNRFGSDKPDLRFGMELHDIKDIFVSAEFNVFKQADTIKAICVQGAADEIGRNEIDKTLTPLAQKHGAKGLAWMRMGADGFEAGISKFLSATEFAAVAERLNVTAGDYVFFVADNHKTACEALGAVRSFLGKRLELADPNVLAFAWIIDFPMYERDEKTGELDFSHNPFSMPQGGLEALNSQDPLDIVGYQYDIICNGFEISSGAVRNYQPEIMYKAFEIAGHDKSVVDEKFGHMIKAFSYGAPPHCGFAPGVERLIMILAGEDTIRQVTAFPKNSKGQDPVVGAPAVVDQEQLDILGLQLKPKKEDA